MRVAEQSISQYSLSSVYLSRFRIVAETIAWRWDVQKLIEPAPAAAPEAGTDFGVRTCRTLCRLLSHSFTSVKSRTTGSLTRGSEALSLSRI
jgi:hypothetical protein